MTKQFWVGMLVAGMSMSLMIMAMEARKVNAVLYDSPRAEVENIVTAAVGGKEY